MLSFAHAVGKSAKLLKADVLNTYFEHIVLR